MAKATAYNTNLASEFYVLSVLNRLGLNANLTLGSRKSVDIVVEKPGGEIITIDVKGMVRKTAWFVGNIQRQEPSHFVIFVCYLDKIEEVSVMPDSFIVPSIRLKEITHTNPGGVKQVLYSHVRDTEFKEAWHLLI